MEIRQYGQFSGAGSLSWVSRAFRRELIKAGHTVHEFDTRRMLQEDNYVVEGAFAPHALFTAELQSVGLLQHNCRHAERWLMVAPNGTRLPNRLAAAIDQYSTRVLTPSQWGKKVCEYYFGDKVEVVPHGVAPEFVFDASLREKTHHSYLNDEFHVVHLSTSLTDRKATLALVQAWDQVVRHNTGRFMTLTLVLDSTSRIDLVRRLTEEGMSLPHGVHITQRVDSAPASMAQYLQGFHLVCQPSRAEGFGLLPLEARACGMPVVQTGCTGHADALVDSTAGVVIVPNGDLEPLDEAPGSQAPSVSCKDIMDALLFAENNWQELAARAAEAAESVRTAWSWQRQLAPWIQKLKETTV